MPAATETQSSDRAPLTLWLGFAMMCVGMFMAVPDIQVVATSLPTIQNALNIPPARPLLCACNEPDGPDRRRL
jgi:DHA2 family multidrug resistance protein